MSAAGITQHPLFASVASHGRRVVSRLRQVPAQRWRWLCLVIVLLWAVHNLAQAVWLIFPAPDLEQPPLAPPPTVSDSAPGAAAVDLAAIQQAELFGVAGAAPVAEPDPEPEMLPGIEQEAVDTSLNLQLEGVIASSEPDNAWAIIASGNRQALYKVGDKLPQGNNVTLAKVLEQRVILNNNGRYESLWLYSEEDAQRRASVNRDEMPDESWRSTLDSNTDVDADSGIARPEDGYQSGGAPEPELEPEEFTEEPELVELPSSAVENVSSISDVVRFTAARGNTGMMGYRVQPGRNRALFDQAGLQPGDIVIAVNGISLDDPQQIRAVYQELQSATQAELSILRDGEPVSVYISLDSAR